MRPEVINFIVKNVVVFVNDYLEVYQTGYGQGSLAVVLLIEGIHFGDQLLGSNCWLLGSVELLLLGLLVGVVHWLLYWVVCAVLLLLLLIRLLGIG